MPGTIKRTLPIAVALLALAACSSTTGDGSSPSSSASSAPYRAACKAEDTAYQQAGYVFSDIESPHAYAALQSYKEGIDNAGTSAITGSKLWSDLNAESLKVNSLSNDLDISQSVVQDSMNEFNAARSAVVADCKSYGYVYATKTG